MYDPSLYLNRELSWLEFNARVLAQAQDERTPLIERLKFLCISSTNLDEFFEIRVGRLQQQIHLGDMRSGPDGMVPSTQLRRISERAHRFVADQYKILNDILLPELREQGIRFVRRTQWNDAQAQWVSRYFNSEVLPVLSPLGLDPAHPFPRVLNKSLNFIVSLEGQDAFGRQSGIAVVQAPRSLPRVIPMDKLDGSGSGHDFVFLSSVIHAHVNELFPGMVVKGCYQFRVTRNSDLFVDEEEVEDLMIALEDELYTRNYGDAVRLEVADNCPLDVARFLLDQFNLSEEHLYQVNGPVNLNRLMTLTGIVNRPDLKDPPLLQTVRPAQVRKVDLFGLLRKKDLLLHHPFESFTTVSELFRQAAQDPKVLAIKHALYRTETDSLIVDALAEAARNGKEVTAVIELRARFDEERNIGIASKLQEAGAHVVYGVVGYKIHAKMTLIVRREAHGLQRYVHLGTGNYHPKTTKLYTDYGLMTTDADLGQDVHQMFQQLTGLGQVVQMNKLYQSPFTLYPAIIEKIDREVAHAKAGRPAKIMAKMNSLTEPGIVRALYKASRAGVEIDLIVRGVCRLRPGVEGVSQNIRVRSVVGRFLEHTRVYYFQNHDAPEVFISSADWMTRNLHRRVESCVPIEDESLAERVVDETFTTYLRDNQQAWQLDAQGEYTRVQPGQKQKPFNAQYELLRRLSESI